MHKSLRQWQEEFRSTYREKDQRDYTAADLLLHVIEQTAEIAESFRKEEKLAEVLLAHFFVWIVSFADRIEIDVEDATFRKYHGLCPYCGKKQNCICISSETKPKRWHRDNHAKRPNSLNMWQKFFDRVYGNVNKVAGRDKVWLHLLEEVGEVSKDFRLKNKKGISEELADTFAWFFSLCNRLNVDLDKVIFNTFPGRCDVCKNTKCSCPPV